jgi:cytoskeletal protein CcmA (bactofilin family)
LYAAIKLSAFGNVFAALDCTLSGSEASFMVSPKSGPQFVDGFRGEKTVAFLPTSPFVPPATGASGGSVLGTDLTILGEKIIIISQSKLQIDGAIKGVVHGKAVLINKGGSVTGEIWAERIDVRGEVHGSMIAVTLAIHASAKVAGHVMHQKLSISEGAEFDGRVQLIRDPSELMPILDADALERGRPNAEMPPLTETIKTNLLDPGPPQISC